MGGAAPHPGWPPRYNVVRTTADSAVAPTHAKALRERDGLAVRQHVETMRAASIDPSALGIGGQLVAELFVEVARCAGEPLTRAALNAAAESTRDRELGLAAGPITIGPNDHRPLARELPDGASRHGAALLLPDWAHHQSRAMSGHRVRASAPAGC